jgi:hypothetical protein
VKERLGKVKRAEGSISGGFWAVETGARADGWLRARSDSRPKPWPLESLIG